MKGRQTAHLIEFCRDCSIKHVAVHFKDIHAVQIIPERGGNGAREHVVAKIQVVDNRLFQFDWDGAVKVISR